MRQIPITLVLNLIGQELSKGQGALEYGREREASQHLYAADTLFTLINFEELHIRHNWPFEIEPEMRAAIKVLIAERDSLHQALVDYPEND